jgi:G:T-mismatch repair DNA endonuclease (very short patch repair protein)
MGIKGVIQKYRKQYWLIRGFSEEESASKADFYSKLRNSWTLEYWISKGFSKEESLEKLEKKRLEVSERRKANPIEFKRENCKSCIEWWLKNYSEEEANLLHKQHLKSIQKELLIPPSQTRYWVAKGFSEEESKVKVLEFNTRNKEFFIKRYGKEDGEKRHKERSEKFSENTVFKKETGRVEEIQNLARLNNPLQRDYWVAKGFSEKEAKEKSNEVRRYTSPKFKEYWIEKGFSEVEAEEKKNTYNSYMCNEALKSMYTREFKNNSKGEKELYKIVKFYSWTALRNQSFNIGDRWCFPDIVIDDKLVIEYQGDYYHANPAFYEPSRKMLGSTASEIHKVDERRKKLLESLGFAVEIVWEYDWVSCKDKHELVKNLLRKYDAISGQKIIKR